jgi:beta-galactosidase
MIARGKMRLLLRACAFVAAGLLLAASVALARPEFHPDQIWTDAAGNPIQAHGGGVLVHNNMFYWYGEDRTPGLRGGVSCYASTNLYDWTREGQALPPESLPRINGHPTFVERPKVIFNPRTKKFVMWMHMEQWGSYRFASVGIAVGEHPAGPFTFLNAFRPNGNMSRDMTLYLDDDGKAYEIYAARDNYDMRICRLSDDFLSATATDVIIAGDHREAPALFKYRGRYYLITSACTGWAPNAANYYTADHILGPWTVHPNPCRGPKAQTTFDAQSTFVLPVPGRKGAFIFMADHWKPRDLPNSTCIWLPLQIKGDTLTIEWHDAWNLSWFDKQPQ